MIPTAAIGRPTGCATPATYPTNNVEMASKTKQIINMVLDGVQTVLDVVGLIPAVGEPADAANAAIYTARGDYANAALSAAACIPIVGSLGTTAKLVNKGSQVVDTVVDGAKVIDNLVDTSKIVDKVNDAGKAVDNINDVSKGIDVTKQTSNVTSEVIEGGLDGIRKGNLDDLPDNALEMFGKYDKAGWNGTVPGQTPGTAAGSKYLNKDGKLPTMDSAGNSMTYKEFDVNNKLPNANRDAQRFLKGSDGSIYYTDDHYSTFIKIK
jgi:guanyl-specific ribonuclease Sa